MESAERAEALKILGKLLLGRRERKSEELLRPCDAAASHGWHVYVPPSFNRALDMKFDRKKGMFMQGSRFAFKAGDRLYDTHKAYGKWSEAVPEIHFCVEVRRASDASPASRTAARNPGTVEFAVYGKSADGSVFTEQKTLSSTQDGFVWFLISGEECGAR